VLVATTPDAGGDLLDLDLASGSHVDRTSAAAPQSFVPDGLHLAATWGVAGTDQGLLRFDRASSADAAPLPFPAVPTAFFSGQVALSRNGAWAVTTPERRRPSSTCSCSSSRGRDPGHDRAGVDLARGLPARAPARAVPRGLGRRHALRVAHRGLTREAFLAEVPQRPRSPTTS